MESIEVLKATKGSQRGQIIAFMDHLADDPGTLGDYYEKDDADRRIEIKVVGQYAISFWADHAAREIKVVDIRRADRA